MVRTKASAEAEKKIKTDERERRYKEARKKQLTKREEARKNLGKKRGKHSKALPIAMLILVAVGVVIALSLTVLFKINEIAVSGKTRYSNDEIIANAGVINGDNLIVIDAERISADLMIRLPYLGKVEVSRSLPSKLKITVADATPAYIFAVNTGYCITDKNYKVLEIVSAIPKGNKLTVVNGVGLSAVTPGKALEAESNVSNNENEKGMNNLRKLVEGFEKYKLTDITEINIALSGDLRFTYAGRIECKVGSTANLDYKVKFAKKVLNEKLEKTDTGTLDLTTATNDSIYFKHHILKKDENSSDTTKNKNDNQSKEASN